MTIEEKLKEYILTKHKSIREFVKCTDLPYSTVDGILKRGIANSSIGNVLKICKALGISADELANNRIAPLNANLSLDIFIPEIPKMVSYVRNNLEDYSVITIDDKPLTPDEWDILLDSITLSVDFVRNYRNKKRKKG